jgi:hypothetical protein
VFELEENKEIENDEASNSVPNETSTSEAPMKTDAGANHSVWVNTAQFNQFKINSRMLHKKSASERIDAFILSENQKDNGGSSALCSMALEDRALSNLRSCEVEITKLNKILRANETEWESMSRIATALGVSVRGKPQRGQSQNILLSEVDDKLMCKLYNADAKGIDEDSWDYFCQLTEELRKKANLKKTLRDIRSKKLRD